MEAINRFESVPSLTERAKLRTRIELLRQIESSELVFRCKEHAEGWTVCSSRHLGGAIDVEPCFEHGLIRFSIPLGAVIDERNATALRALASHYSAHAFKIAEFWGEAPEADADAGNGAAGKKTGWRPGDVVHMVFVRALGDESPTVSVYRLATSAEDVAQAFAGVAAGRMGPREAVEQARS